MRKNSKCLGLLLLIIMMLANLAGCSSESTKTASGLVENVINPVEAAEMDTEEAAPETEDGTRMSYIEKQELQFYGETSAETTGVLCLADHTDDADVIDTTWYLDDIYVLEESGKQTITIKQHVDGYFWGNGSDVFKTNLMLPSGKIYDRYTGVMIPASTEDVAKETTVEWDGKKYILTNVESHEWKNDEWTNWVKDPNGGERLKSTLYVTNQITVDSADYDGLALLLQPIIDFSGSIDGAYIADAWTDECYLFNVSDFVETFKIARAEAEAVETIETEEIETSEAEEVPVETEEKTVKTKDDQKPAAPAHKHDYKSAVTKSPTCSSAGVKTFTCSCGDSYTEAIGTTEHDFSVPIIETVWHDEVWQTVPREVTVKYIECVKCGGIFYSTEEYTAHALASLEALGENATANAILNSCANSSCNYCKETQTVYDQVKISDGYFEEVTVGYKCAVCGVVK